MWLVHSYDWLVANNLWKAAVAFFVTLILGVAISLVLRPWRAWKAHRSAQEKIADRLNTSTPGGLTDLVHALNEVLDALREGEAPDDNGSDDQQRKKPHGTKILPGHELPGGHGGITDIPHGGAGTHH